MMSKVKKVLLVVLMLCKICAAQTIHVEEENIIYKGTIPVPVAPANELISRINKIIGDHIDDKKNYKRRTGSSPNTLACINSIKLSNSNRHLKEFTFRVEVAIENGYCHYTIDSFYLVEKEPAAKPVETSAKELLKKMESSGPVAAATERDLNEMDMNIEKFIDFIRNGMKE